MQDHSQPVHHDWKLRLTELLPLYGHRNWIVVADSAYPVQSNPGIETIVAGGDHLSVIKHVFLSIAQTRHVRANVFADRELEFVSVSDAPGVLDYSRKLGAVLPGVSISFLPHEQIIQKLDESAKLFRVLIVKTDMTVPYTSVFFQLDCGYWSADAEQRLRKAMLEKSK